MADFKKITREILYCLFAAAVASAILFGAFCYIMIPEDRTFDTLYYSTEDEVMALLVQQGVCPSKGACIRTITFRGIDRGLALQVHGVTDPSILAKIIEIYERKFFETSGMRRVTIDAYRTKENLNRLGSDILESDRIFTIEVRRTQ